MKKHNYGFTLAEVLITLVIIGIVAAMTIPVIFANHKKEETLSRLKKFYSTLNQASLLAQAEGNDWNYWANDSSSKLVDTTNQASDKFAKQYLLPYLNFQKYEIMDAFVYIYLNDGSYFKVAKGGCIDFQYDTNGGKNPNKFGRDIFYFLYCPAADNSNWETNKIIPYQHKNTTREQALENCKQEPYYCSSLLMLDNWQFKKDYPYEI